MPEVPQKQKNMLKYVNTAKLEAVKALMEKERLRLWEAAALFGFSDPNYVSRLYKRYFGKNITDFKKEG